MAGIFNDGGGVICDKCGGYFQREHSGNLVINLQVMKDSVDHGRPIRRIRPVVIKSYNLCGGCLEDFINTYKDWMKYKWDKEPHYPKEYQKKEKTPDV